MPALHERIAGGLWGLLVGDALGVPYEFHEPHDLPPRHQLEMRPPASFRRAHAHVPPATWSDDGAQALALLASLLDQGKLDLDDFGQRLLNDGCVICEVRSWSSRCCGSSCNALVRYNGYSSTLSSIA